MEVHKGFTLDSTKIVQPVWCPTTETGTWIAKHPDTGQEFITGNSTHSAP